MSPHSATLALDIYGDADSTCRPAVESALKNHDWVKSETANTTWKHADLKLASNSKSTSDKIKDLLTGLVKSEAGLIAKIKKLKGNDEKELITGMIQYGDLGHYEFKFFAENNELRLHVKKSS